MKRHFTATVVIQHEDLVLLVHHRKIGSWVPPGGHVEEDETPAEAAVREAHEETGLHIELVDHGRLRIAYPHSQSFPCPYLCLVVDAAAGTEPAHQHIDFLYLGRPKAGELTTNLVETHALRWFSRAEIENLKKEEILPDVREILLSTMRNEVLV